MKIKYFCFQIAGVDYVATYDAKVTYEGCPARYEGPLAGPAEGPEFEVTVTSLRLDVPMTHPLHAPVELPKWLQIQIEEAIHDDSDTAAAVLQEHFERQENGRERAEEDRADMMREDDCTAT